MASGTDFSPDHTCYKVDTGTISETESIKNNQSDSRNAYQTMITCHEKIAHGLSKEPQAMATALHSRGFISDETLREINEVSNTNLNKGERLCSEVLREVKEYPHRYKEFIDILNASEVLHKELLETLSHTHHRLTQGGTFPEPESSVSIYARYLKEQYLKQPILQDDPWPPSMGQHYINLALVEHSKNDKAQTYFQEDLLRGKIDSIQRKKKDVSINEAIEKDKQCQAGLKVLIDGAPGVGKTTLSRKICQDWAKGELLKDCLLLIYIPLRISKLAKATCIEELFYHDDPDIVSAVVKHIRKTGGADVIFLFDGYDELSRRERDKESLFLDIFNGRILCKCSVLICSRPYASEKLQRSSSLTRHIEVLGFNEKQIEKCISSGIQDPAKARHLLDELRNRQDLLSFCYIPLNCAILIYVYKFAECRIPDTITELFTLFIQNTFQRQIDIHGTKKKILEKFKKDLAELAYHSMIEEKLAFENDDVPESEEARLGLMTAAKSFTRSGIEISHQFIHLTVHEYLAATWMANGLTEKEQAEFLQNNLMDDRFRMVFIFLAGLTKLESEHYKRVLSTRNLQLTKNTKVPSDDIDREMKKQFNLLIHLTHESQSQQACCALAKSVQEQVLQYQVSDNFELTIFGHFISQSNSTWEYISLTIMEGDTRENLIKFERFVQHIQQAPQRTVIKRFSLHYSNSKYYGLSPLPKMLWTMFATSTFRDLRYIEASQGSGRTDVISDFKGPSEACNRTIISNLENLEHIFFENIGLNPIMVEESLIPIIARCRKTLKTIVLEGKEHIMTWCPSLSIDSLIAFTKLIWQLPFPAVEQMHIDIGPFPLDLPVEDVDGILMMVYHSASLLLKIKTLRSLSLYGTFSWSPHETSPSETLTEQLASLDQIFGSKQTINLFILAFITTRKLKYLKLNTFFLFNCTRGELFIMLAKNKFLTTFNLMIDYYASSARVLEQLAQGMKQNSALKKLIVSIGYTNEKNLFGEEDDSENINQLLRNLRYHPTLNVLILKGCNLSNWIELSTLLLYNSRITTVGVRALGKFPQNKIKAVAPCLVLNGRRTEFDFRGFSDYYGNADKDIETLQSDVDEFKGAIFFSMVKLMSHLLKHRLTFQSNVLDVWSKGTVYP